MGDLPLISTYRAYPGILKPSQQVREDLVAGPVRVVVAQRNDFSRGLAYGERHLLAHARPRDRED